MAQVIEIDVSDASTGRVLLVALGSPCPARACSLPACVPLLGNAAIEKDNGSIIAPLAECPAPRLHPLPRACCRLHARTWLHCAWTQALEMSGRRRRPAKKRAKKKGRARSSLVQRFGRVPWTDLRPGVAAFSAAPHAHLGTHHAPRTLTHSTSNLAQQHRTHGRTRPTTHAR